MDFFTPTQEEIKKALSGSDCNWNHGDVVNFMINKVVEDTTKGYMRVENKVLTGDNKDKTYSLFFRNNEWGLKDYIQLMKCFYTDEQILSNTVNLTTAIGKMYQAKCRISKKDEKEYVHWNYQKEVSTVPDMAQAMGATEAQATAPTNNVLI